MKAGNDISWSAVIVIAAFLLATGGVMASCGNTTTTEDRDVPPAPPDRIKLLRWSYGGVSVEPVELNGGTRCVVALSNGKVAIDCDWSETTAGAGR